MATETVHAPVNGNYGHHQTNPYAAAEQNFGSHQANNSTSTAGYTTTTPAAQQTSASDVSKEEVAWYFVEQYYTTMSRNPEKLYLFFNKRSQFVAGVEDEKVDICFGQSAIKDRLKQLDYHDCKVRVTNVDSQASEDKIIIQVIGQMSNKSQPHRKFAQTFVLAAQTNGYFVLNDIFRYLSDDDEEPEAAAAPAEVSVGFQDPAPTAVDPAHVKETISREDVAVVDKKLEEVALQEPVNEQAPATTDGLPIETESEIVVAEEAPEIAVPVSAEVKAEAPEEPALEEISEPEKPKEQPSTSAPDSKSSPRAVENTPPKPAVPLSWAQLASSKAASTAARALPGSASAPTSKKPTSATAQPKSAQVPVTSTVPAASSSGPPIRETSPADSGKESSSGGWKTAGADHSRKASRAQPQPMVGQDGKVRAYVKNVYQSVDAEALKDALSKFGELAYFDVSRPKNSAFVEFATVAGFQAAVAANPHKIGTDTVLVEERRPAGQFNARGGGLRGGRPAGYEPRPGQGQGRGGFKEGGASRGNFNGGRGGRGGGRATTTTA